MTSREENVEFSLLAILQTQVMLSFKSWNDNNYYEFCNGLNFVLYSLMPQAVNSAANVHFTPAVCQLMYWT